MDDRQRLEAIVSVINKYLPPDGIPINDAMSEIISLVDPLPAPQPVQEPVSFPCCGYTDANAIRWNQFNGVVQCHMCGQVYTVAQPVQEPVKMVAYNCFCGRTMKFESVHGVVAPQRAWVGLTDDEIKEIVGPYGDTPVKGYTRKLFDRIEQALKEKNT